LAVPPTEFPDLRLHSRPKKDLDVSDGDIDQGAHGDRGGTQK
jgi:hypothetical protein